LRIAGAYVSDFRTRTTLASDMAQTYNQKKNVYSIDQILGHGKDEGTTVSSFFLSIKHAQIFYARWNI